MNLQSPIDPHSEGRRVRNLIALIGLIVIGVIMLALSHQVHGAQLSPTTKTRNISAAWSYNYGPMPACGPHLGVNCVNGFQVGTWNGTACSDILRVANPPNPTGVVTGIHVNWKSTEPATAIFCVAATWFDFQGTFKVAAAAIEGTKTQAAGDVKDFMVLRR